MAIRCIITITGADICLRIVDKKYLGGKNMKKFLALTLSACLAIGALAGCSSSSSTSDGSSSEASGENVIKIGVFEPQTGENGGGGLQEVYGIRYANQVYPTVDINGTEYTIQLVEVDNKSDKTEAVTAAQKLVSEGVIVSLDHTVQVFPSLPAIFLLTQASLPSDAHAQILR